MVTTKSYTNWGTIVLQLGYDWGPIGTQLAPNWPSVTTNWVNRRGLYYCIKLLIEQSSNQIVARSSRLILLYHVLYTICILFQNKRSWKEHVHDRIFCMRGDHTKNSNDDSRVRANRINSATPLVIMSSLYMRQIVKSMVNWNIYNDNIMTSGVA